MGPSNDGYGIIQAVSSTFWIALKKAFPEFIHSMTKDELKAVIAEGVQPDHVSASLDGSSWDSSQDAELQLLVETAFLNGISPEILSLVRYNKDLISPDEGPSAEQIHANLMRAFNSVVNHVFMRLP